MTKPEAVILIKEYCTAIEIAEKATTSYELVEAIKFADYPEEWLNGDLEKEKEQVILYSESCCLDIEKVYPKLIDGVAV